MGILGLTRGYNQAKAGVNNAMKQSQDSQPARDKGMVPLLYLATFL